MLGWQVLGEQAEDTILIVSELVGNASRHALGPIVMVTLTLTDALLLIEVWDSNDYVPHSQPAGDDAESGRGLLMVEALSLRSGGHASQGGKVMWAELTCAVGPTVRATTDPSA